MNEEKLSLYKRIRNARKSLENAEKSFQDDKGMRGELDLMLAEAELKNLRNKQAFPWSWNRNTLAMCFAVIIFFAGIAGWLIAAENKQIKEFPKNVATENKQLNVVPTSKAEIDAKESNKNKEVYPSKVENNTGGDSTPAVVPKVQISEKDMRNLVRKAKSELSSGK